MSAAVIRGGRRDPVGQGETAALTPDFWCGSPLGVRRDTTIVVNCDPARGEPGNRHRVTVTKSRQVRTRHNLDHERIAVALGARVGCVDLVDRILPALWHEIDLKARRILPDLRFLEPTGEDVWPMAKVICGPRCSPLATMSAPVALEHIRSVDHIRRLYGVDTPALQRFHGQLGWLTTYVARSEPGKEEVRRAEKCVSGERNLKLLWDFGFHPVLVSRIHAAVGRPELRLPVSFFLATATKRPSLKRLAKLGTLAGIDEIVAEAWASRRPATPRGGLAARREPLLGLSNSSSTTAGEGSA